MSVLEDTGQPVAMMFFLRRLPHLSREEFHSYWKNNHGPLISSLFPDLGCLRYEQWHLTKTGGSSAERRGMDVAPENEYDGVAVLWYESLQAYTGLVATPARKGAGEKALADERNFIDLPRCAMMVCEPRHRWANAAAGVTLNTLSIPGPHVTFPLKRQASGDFVSDEDFYTRWKFGHGPIVNGVAPNFAGLRYEQCKSA